MSDYAYTNAEENLAVSFDPEDDGLPICIEVDGRGLWYSPTDSREAAEAILTALDGEKYVAGDADYKTEVIRFALAHGKTVQFRYAKGSGDVIEQRRLAPQLVQEVKGNVLVVGDDPDRDGDTRAYRIDRIKGDPVIV